MSGYDVDPVALRSAINKLKEARKRTLSLGNEASRLEAGELTANDAATDTARKAFDGRASTQQHSLQEFSRFLADKIQEKIDAYEQTLKQYEEADQSAAELQSRL
ncbi:hypothetical protein [Bounagaea algeriensis]